MTDDERSTLLEELKAKHGKVYFFDEPEEFGLVVFRKPGKLDFRALKADREDDTKRPVADEIFARKLVVYPDAAGFEKILDEYPVLATNISGRAMELAGGAKVEVKKA